MVNVANRIEVREVRPGAADYTAALHKALSLDVAPTAAAIHPSAAEFVASVERRRLTLDPVFAGFEGDRILGACLAVVSPGSSALVHATAPESSVPARRGTAAALAALVSAARTRRLALLEALVDPNDLASADALQGGGFRLLTRLIYLRRRSDSRSGACDRASWLSWITYSDDAGPLFRSAIERSYAGSLDCPELAGVRDVSEVVEGHRAVGAFDPDSWWVAMDGGQPVGVMLLNDLPPTSLLEVVYMGVAQAARGKGVGDALLARAVEACRSRSMRGLALAVDERNAPARRLYERWGFVETGVRAAWIATPLLDHG